MLLVKLGPPPPPSLPVPVYLLRLDLALRRSKRTLSKSDKSSANSRERLRTECSTAGVIYQYGKELMTPGSRGGITQTGPAQTRGQKLTVDTLVLAGLVGVMKVAQDLDETEMTAGVVNHSL